MAEEDIAKIREDLTQTQAASMTLLGIVRENTETLAEIKGAVHALQINGTIVDARLSAIDARISTLDAKMDYLIQLLTKPQQ